jgi:2-iminoacetate synthase
MKTNPMDYLEGMEAVDSSLMEETLLAAAAYDAEKYTQADVRRALENREPGVDDFGALLSPAAMPFLEEMAGLAQRARLAHFGNSVYLFTPLYIANYCENQCVYCGFNCRNSIKRARLEIGEIEEEMKLIAATGLEEILLLTGESEKMSGLAYIGEACKLARKYFRVTGLEIYPVNSGDYAYLRQCGADFVTVFQETYDPENYGELHPGGRKRVFPYRFTAPDRAFRGGRRGAGFAALLGLGDFRRDAFAAGIHARLVQRKYPQGEISFSCPRLRPIVNNSNSEAALAAGTPDNRDFLRHQAQEIHICNRLPGEAELLQIICAYRIFMPFAGITISSRENARFRDHAVSIGATKISAGVDVGIGRRGGGADGDGQFEIADDRSVREIRDMILSRSLQPVMSDYIYV